MRAIADLRTPKLRRCVYRWRNDRRTFCRVERATSIVSIPCYHILSRTYSLSSKIRENSGTHGYFVSQVARLFRDVSATVSTSVAQAVAEVITIVLTIRRTSSHICGNSDLQGPLSTFLVQDGTY